MACRALCVAVLLSCLPAAGCGTVVNVVKPGPDQGGSGKLPFGGVRHDLWSIERATSGEYAFKSCPQSEAEHYRQLALMLGCAADLPFSLIGDVVTWPYTASYSFINQPVPAPPLAQAPVDGPPQAYFRPENKEPELNTPEKAASSNHWNAYVTMLLQTQPLVAAACSGYFLAPPTYETPPQLPMTLPIPRKETPKGKLPARQP